MAIRDSIGGYKCSYCGKHWANQFDADICRDGHDLVYIVMQRADLNRLIQFIYTGERELITETMIADLRKLVKGVAGL